MIANLPDGPAEISRKLVQSVAQVTEFMLELVPDNFCQFVASLSQVFLDDLGDGCKLIFAYLQSRRDRNRRAVFDVVRIIRVREPSVPHGPNECGSQLVDHVPQDLDLFSQSAHSLDELLGLFAV